MFKFVKCTTASQQTSYALTRQSDFALKEELDLQLTTTNSLMVEELSSTLAVDSSQKGTLLELLDLPNVQNFAGNSEACPKNVKYPMSSTLSSTILVLVDVVSSLCMEETNPTHLGSQELIKLLTPMF
jgi:hypothetical protein